MSVLNECCFSDDRLYRYSLRRRVGESSRRILFIMLNPSVADEKKNDPTVARCMMRSQKMGYGVCSIVNLFALRATDPRDLYRHSSPVGPLNDSIIQTEAEGASLIICGWGKHGSLKGRGKEVQSILEKMDRIPFALKVNGDGTPRHPLYVGYNVTPIMFCSSTREGKVQP